MSLLDRVSVMLAMGMEFDDVVLHAFLIHHFLGVS